MKNSGQTLLEFTLSATALVLVVSGAGWILSAQWERARCAHLVFEQTHRQLVGLPVRASASVKIRDLGDSVQGEGRCRDAQEAVTLKKLEAASW